MFALVNVILPISDVAPAEAIRASLEPFRRGGRGDVPDAWLSFHDEAEHIRAMHGTAFPFTNLDGSGMRIEGGDHHHLRLGATRRAMMLHGPRRQPRARLSECSRSAHDRGHQVLRVSSGGRWRYAAN